MNREVPIFFAVDDNYIPCLGVCLESIKEHATENHIYCIRILHTDVKEENQKKIKCFEQENIKIEFVNLEDYIAQVKEKLYTRDYYTNTTYFRLFLPNLYPQYEKGIYLDADIVLLDDIANLYEIDMQGNLIAGVTDGVMATVPELKRYCEVVVGVDSYKNYFNAGVILMNFKGLRDTNFKEKFLHALDTIKFKVAQDQDYLNRICMGKVLMIDPNWDVMPCNYENHKDESKIRLIHYNLSEKPWHYENIPLGNYFWKYAKNTEFYEELLEELKNYSEEKKQKDQIIFENLKLLADKETKEKVGC